MNVFSFIIKDNISPNGQYYYKLKPAVCLNPAAFGSEVAFYDSNDNLLYHNNEAIAHELNDPYNVENGRVAMVGSEMTNDSTRSNEPILRIATWSKQGNMAHIVEYFKFEQSYYNVFLNLKEQYQIRAIMSDGGNERYLSIPAQKLTDMGIYKPDFDENEVLNILNAMNIKGIEPMATDPVRTSFFKELFPKNRWYK